MTHLHQLPIQHYKTTYGLKNFVETGCYQGEGLREATNSGFLQENIYTCDIGSGFVALVSSQYPEANVVLKDSCDFLGTTLKEVQGPALFWLDAHFPAFFNLEGGAELDWPVLKELDIIRSVRDTSKDVIMCDDMRCLRHPENPHWRGDVGPEHTIDGQWELLNQMFGDTHNIEQQGLMDTGVLVFIPKVV
ncbi:MAG: hypothetical protein WCQ50_10775 [Spirochaetota bacterium]